MTPKCNFFLTLRRIFFIESQAAFWLSWPKTAKTGPKLPISPPKSGFIQKNDIDINYPEFSSDFF